MYLSIKKLSNNYYLYIVGNTRDNLSGRPLKKTLAYLGRLKDYSKKEMRELREKLKRDEPDLIDYIIKLSNKKDMKKFLRKTDKKKVEKRGGNCIVCGFDSIVHLHHIVPISEGGLFNKRNLVCLCPNHHAMLHKGIITEEDIQIYMNENSKCKGYKKLISNNVGGKNVRR